MRSQISIWNRRRPGAYSSSFKQCLEDGVRTNAALKSAEPWRLYFPDEVIVMASFGTLEDAQCFSNSDATKDFVCSGGTEVSSDVSGVAALDAHLGDAEKDGGIGAVYNGMRTGRGLVDGIVQEVLLKPEDILRVSGLLL